MKRLKGNSPIKACLLSCFCAMSLTACTGPQGPAGPPGPAGSGGNVTAFRHTHTAANECASPTPTLFSVLDHPSLNGQADALVFLTALVGINGGRTHTNPNSNLLVVYTGSQTFGTCPAERWLISGGDISLGAQFDVMVASP